MGLMINRIVLSRSGFEVEYWDAETRSHPRRPIDDLFSYLRYPLEIEGEVTLGRLFEIVDLLPGLKQFLDSYAHAAIDEFHEEAKKPLTDLENLLVALEVNRIVEISHITGFNSFCTFTGIGSDEERYGIGLTPMNEIANVPIRVNPFAHVLHEDTDEVWDDYRIKGSFSVLDVLDAIYWGISFYGPPQKRDRTWREIVADEPE